MPWVPDQEELHQFALVLRHTGKCEVTLTDGKDANMKYHYAWSSPRLQDQFFHDAAHGKQLVFRTEGCKEIISEHLAIAFCP